MESEQLFHRGYYRNSYNSITSASSDEELLDGAGVIMDFQTSEDDNLLDGDTAVGKFIITIFICSHEYLPINTYIVLLRLTF
jgi:chloride channel 3/4/5